MDLLRQTIAKRKQETDMGPKKKKKFLTRGEIEAERERAYREEERKREEERRAKQEKEEAEAAALRKAVAKDEGIEEEEDDDIPIPAKLPPPGEITRRLRASDQPAILFGEEEVDRYRRMVIAESTRKETNPGMRNEYAMQLKQDEEAALNEFLSEKKRDKEAKEQRRLDAVKRMEEENAMFANGEPVKLVKDDVVDKEDKVYQHFKKLLSMWENELNARDDERKASAAGKSEKVSWKQSKEYIKPMFKLLKSKTIEKDILKELMEIVNALEGRDYVKANEIYLRLAIGNAPWPIGVTMVGIHERSGREKIYAQKVAHVLNDETQRKYISSVKRLMTYQQSRFSTDPSRSFGVAGSFT